MDLNFKEADLTQLKTLAKEMNYFVMSPEIEISENGKVQVIEKEHLYDGIIKKKYPYKNAEIIPYIALNGKTIVGYCFVAVSKNKSAQITYMSARSGHQKIGIGTKLVEFINDDLAKRKIRIVNLVADLSAVGFYEKRSLFKKRNSNTKRPKSFFNPVGKIATVFGFKPRRKIK